MMHARAAASLLLAIATIPVSAQTRSPSPSPDCLDARRMQEVRQVEPRALTVLTQDDRRFRVDLASDCPVGTGDAILLAQEGWVCGRAREFVRTGERLCPISGLQTIDAREYAALARAGDRDQAGIATLDAVQVRAERRQGFAGSYSYCFNPRYMRAWSEDSEGLLVEMSPRRAGGNRYYRVELSQSCPDLYSAPAVIFQSGVGIGLICGNPGDQVLAQTEREDVERAYLQGNGITPNFNPRRARATRCAVTAVYPHQPGQK
ncbi:hypothetical protein [Pseudoxanthomonas sp. UTMC 1351]|uniref:hypothetical protein n=1 Tax=Pseudoxanthomonas sp. UTMC 1351 TaxID=2695853 RepID=UPI0034CE071B